MLWMLVSDDLVWVFQKVLIPCWDFHTQQYLEFKQHKKRELCGWTHLDDAQDQMSISQKDIAPQIIRLYSISECTTSNRKVDEPNHLMFLSSQTRTRIWDHHEHRLSQARQMKIIKNITWSFYSLQLSSLCEWNTMWSFTVVAHQCLICCDALKCISTQLGCTEWWFELL